MKKGYQKFTRIVTGVDYMKVTMKDYNEKLQ